MWEESSNLYHIYRDHMHTLKKSLKPKLFAEHHDRRWHIENKKEFYFESVSDLKDLTYQEKQSLLEALEGSLSSAESNRVTVMMEVEAGRAELDQNWLKRINYKIGKQRTQRKLLMEHMRQLQGQGLLSAFYDIAKIMLPEKSFEEILSKAKSLSKTSPYI